MKLIITAGGTRERIDSVRSITNEATGRLGSLIVEEFVRRLNGKEHTIYYLCGMSAVVPKAEDADVEIIRIEGTDQLQSKIKELLITQKIDAVIHSMAVSDYKVNSVTTLERVVQAMYHKFHDGQVIATYEEWQQAVTDIIKEQTVEAQQKISSDLKHPLLMLEKTPKVIGMIKETSPKTLLVGFKLLSNVSKEKLIDTAYQLLQRNRCDFVLANDTETIQEGKHVGYLINKTGSYHTYTDKEQIAKGIADHVVKIINCETRKH